MLQTPPRQRLIFGTLTDVAFEGDAERPIVRVTLTDEGMTRSAVTDNAEIMATIGRIMSRTQANSREPLLSLRVTAEPDKELGKPMILSLNGALKADRVITMDRLRGDLGPGFYWRASPIPKVPRKTRLH